MKILKFTLPLVLLGLLIFKIISDWQTVLPLLTNLNYFFLLTSFLVMLLIYPEGALGWYMILRKAKINISLKKAIKIWIVSNTSRYIPGSIWQYISRVEMAKLKANLDRDKTLSSLLLEIFLVLTAGVLMSAFSFSSVRLEEFRIPYWIYLLPFPLLLLHPFFANKILNFLIKFLKKGKVKYQLSLSLKDTLLVFPYFLLNFILNGIALFFLIAAITGNFNLSLSSSIGFYSLSWVIGYVTLLSPGGIGVTEVSLTFLLGLQMPIPVASLVAIVYRFLLTVAELIVFSLCLKKGEND